MNSNSEQCQLSGYPFVTGKSAHCIWETDQSNTDQRFIELFDVDFFEYQSNLHLSHLDSEHKNRAAMAIRLIHYQSMESLFALLGAAIQSPENILGWLVKYQNSDLREVVSTISESKPLHNRWGFTTFSWQEASHLFTPRFATDSDDKYDEHRQETKACWTRLSDAFLDEKSSIGYNSIKHGLRARSSGFKLYFGPPMKNAENVEEHEWTLGAESEHGISLYSPSKMGCPDGVANKHNFYLEHSSLGWSPQSLAKQVSVMSCLMSGIITKIKKKFHQDQTNVKVKHFNDISSYAEAWSENPSLLNMHNRHGLSVASEDLMTKDQIIDSYSRH